MHRNRQSILTTFFTYGNTLPMHRIAHSKYGGIFQPTMTQVIRLLSDPHATSTPPSQGDLTTSPSASPPCPSSLPPSDPFSASELTYTTNGLDSFPAPSFYPSRRHSWIHVFPEGKIHQHPDKIMRYFKWGVARMILESEPCPDVLAMWIDGPQIVMANERTFPRPLPRPGKDVSITFGEKMDVERVFGPFRERWQELVSRAEVKRLRLGDAKQPTIAEESTGTRQLGEVHDHELRYGAAAEQLRKEVTLAVRNEVLKVRRSTGLPDEDPKCSLVETWREEGSLNEAEGKMKDGSVVEDM
jgi:monolysocardiolipin acyltransferase